jgi:endonuclease YncB( thermonuclease family)
MEFASRIFSILLGVAVVALLLWPAKIPLGFGGVWWASQKAQSRPEPPPPPVKPEPQQQPNPPPPPPQAAAQPPAPAPQPEQHAVEPSAAPPKPAQAPEAKAQSDQGAALNENGTKETGASPPQTASKLYYRVTVRDGGTLQSGGVVIKLAGIATRAADATCKNAKGKNWACGAEAKAALARLIRGRAVTCRVPQGPEQKDIVARCSLSGDDLSTWMVRQGWAEPKDANEPALAEAEQAAKKDKLGLWRGSD